MQRVLSTAVVLFLAQLFSGCEKSGQAGAAKMPPPQVIVAPAKAQRIVETLPQLANVQANEMIEIKSEIDGVIEKIHFEEGQRVEAGQLLVQLDESKLAATLAQTEANFQLSKANFDRAKQLHEEQLISQQEFDQAAATFQANVANLDLMRRQLKDARIYAPFEGVMSARNISPGQVISKNTIVSWLIDYDPAKIDFQVPERFLGEVREKQRVEVTVAAFPNERFKGEVFFVSPYVDPTNRTARVKAYVPNPDLKLRPGMFASLELTLTIRENSIVIPEAAITQILTNNQAIIFAVNEEGNAEMKRITTGTRLVGAVEVLAGLRPGEKVIVEGVQKVVPGAPVRIGNVTPAAQAEATVAQQAN